MQCTHAGEIAERKPKDSGGGGKDGGGRKELSHGNTRRDLSQFNMQGWAGEAFSALCNGRAEGTTLSLLARNHSNRLSALVDCAHSTGVPCT